MARGKKATKKTQATAKKEDTTTENGEIQEENGVAKLTKEVQKVVISDRNTTGYLTSLEKSRDIKIERFSLGLHGHELITDTNLEFNWGRRYGLLGLNGSGKSSLLKCLGEREVPIPKWISVYLLEREVEPTDMTALEAVVCDVENEVKRMEAEAEEILVTEGPESERLNTIYEILDEFDPETITPRAASILHGLGFSKQMQQKKTKDFSGGWRMRIALARALFIKPMMLLLDEKFWLLKVLRANV
eukprot:TRINITY_DN9551_c0_g1_i3.p1 TRINITY_DN9551_c0_g1~~TRINITY_DN9551_c0_g1_i3.p1  ORF type:complete len:246 (+),score=85.73 TRINITY_DN9551_c0_g1_i3:78-815(+)